MMHSDEASSEIVVPALSIETACPDRVRVSDDTIMSRFMTLRILYDCLVVRINWTDD